MTFINFTQRRGDAEGSTRSRAALAKDAKSAKEEQEVLNFGKVKGVSHKDTKNTKKGKSVFGEVQDQGRGYDNSFAGMVLQGIEVGYGCC
jgi:hypothetical protein